MDHNRELPQFGEFPAGSAGSGLRDRHGREFAYLRLSLTDICNFRCVYCLPDGFKRSPSAPPELNAAEIVRLITAFAELGLWKLRFTGGEPTVRRDLIDIIEAAAAVPGIGRLALTTNGFRLKKLAAELRAAGIDSINVSVDSLNPESFHRITGHDCLPDVLEGVERALSVGFSSVKINTVLMAKLNSRDIQSLIEWTRSTPISVRFIELMQTGGNAELFERNHFSADRIKRRLLNRGWRFAPRAPGAGPAVELRHDDYAGSVGLIAPYSKDFCADCNRLPVSGRGRLHLCLFGEQGWDLRYLLQSSGAKAELKARIQQLVRQKHAAHYLREGRVGATSNLSIIGG